MPWYGYVLGAAALGICAALLRRELKRRRGKKESKEK